MALNIDTFAPMRKETIATIVIPFYNEENTLNNALEALYNQQDKNGNSVRQFFEIILVDNRSTDASIEIISHFSKQHAELNIFVVSESRAGVAWARKTGMDFACQRSHERDQQYELSKPFYIFGGDADCIVDSHWFDELRQTMESSNAAIGVCQYIYPHDYFSRLPKLFTVVQRLLHFKHFILEYFGGFPDGKGFAVRRDKYEKIGGIEIFYQLQNGQFVCHLSDDWDFGIKMRASDEEIIYCPNSKVFTNPRRLTLALDEMLIGKAYGKNGTIVMRDIRPDKKTKKLPHDLSEAQAKTLWDFAIKDSVPKNLILPLFLTPSFLNQPKVREFLTPTLADELFIRIHEIKNEMQMISFTPIHSYKTPCARLYFEFADPLFERLREKVSSDIGYPPEFPPPLLSFKNSGNLDELKKFIYFYCEDRESGEMHNYFANGGMF